MRVLAFDCSAAHCAAALLSGGRIVAGRREEMARGQAERLMPMLEEILSEAGCGWRDLDRIAVGTGPGNFTGARIAVAAARGLALALRVPAIGVSLFEAHAEGHPRPVAVVLPARQSRVALQVFGTGGTETPREAEDASALPPGLPVAPPCPDPTLAMARIAADATPGARPAPLYLRGPDAQPARPA